MELIERIYFEFGMEYGRSIHTLLTDYPLQIPYLSLFYIEQGEAEITIDFKSYNLRQGSFIVVGEDNIVSFAHTSSSFSMHCFLIQREYASEVAYALPNELFGYLHYYPVQNFSEKATALYSQWQVLILYILKTTSLHTKRIMSNQLQSLFLLLSERVNYDELVLEKNYSRQEELCWKFWDLVTHNARARRDVAFYAEQLFITPYYLSQVTQQFLNYSPKELINRQVILEIKHFLTNTDLNISEIAEQLSFQDPSYMGRFFKRETGVNPMQFRRK